MSEPQYIYVKEKPKTGCVTWVVAVVLVSFLVFFIVELASDSNRSLDSGTRGSGSPVDHPAVELSDVAAKVKDYGGTEITGIIGNRCSVTLRVLSVQFGVFDSAGNKIGEAADYLGSLEPGGTWKFRALCTTSGGKSLRLEGVSCNLGRLLVKDLDEERRAEREKAAADAREAERQAAIAAQKLAAQKQRERKQEALLKTFEFYRKNALAGDGFAQVRLAELYLAGQGVETNIEQARFWLSCASTNERPEVADILKKLPER